MINENDTKYAPGAYMVMYFNKVGMRLHFKDFVRSSFTDAEMTAEGRLFLLEDADSYAVTRVISNSLIPSGYHK